MPVYQWSTTDATNAGVDPTINWAEGQPPSSVNNSARAMMARLAEYREDVSGLPTSGGPNDYTMTSNQKFGALTDMFHMTLCVVFNVTNSSPVTLNVDGLGAMPVRTSPLTEVPAGMLIAGTPYTMRFAAGDHVFYLKNFYGPQLYVVPVGGLLPYIAGAGGVVPNSAFAFPAGQAISRATYSVLFSLIGGVYGAGDGSTTFNLPDLRGRAIFGLDNMGGTNANRITNVIYNGSAIGSAGGEQMHALSAAEMPNHNHSANSYDSGHQHGMGFTGLAGGGGGGAVPNIPPYNQNWSTDIGYAAITTDIGYAGNSYAHNNMPPSMVLNYILRVI